ncbi:hypothetical protein JW826_05300 [Candidatus Woesearchaeota archaeon]|nr:hypothetical protein [Candidatus Woesearchaeota archaeon]
MKIKTKPRIILLFALIFVFYLYYILPSVISWGPIDNYRNFSVRTTVNVTDAMPEIVNITCNNGTAITLNAGTVYPVICKIELKDYNGGNTLNGTGSSGVNASTFYYYLNASEDPDDNNVHYTNSTCEVNGTAFANYSINWTCTFYTWYYANNGTWIINITVHDRYNGRSYNVTGTRNATIGSLYAVNVTNVIDFGDMYVGETSTTSVEANITNFGNMDINISLYGFGGENQTLYPDLAMVCAVRNLSLDTERYSVNGSEAWAAMTPISGTPTALPNMTLIQQQDDSTPVMNATYWRLYIDPISNPFGQCNGTVIFSAESAI